MSPRRSSFRVLIGACLLPLPLFFLVPSAQASVIYSQNFESLNGSTSGTDLNGQGGFSANSTVDVIDAGGIGYSGSGISISGGNKSIKISAATANGGNPNYGSVGFTSTNGATLYFRFTFNYFNVANDGSNDFFRLQFANDSAAGSLNYLGVQLAGGINATTQTETGFGVRARTSTNDSGRVAPGANPYLSVNSSSSPTSYLVTGMLSWNATVSAYKEMTMWINPTTTQAAPTQVSEYFNTATASTTGNNLTALSSMVFQNGATNGNMDTGDILGMDNFLLGTTWSDVVGIYTWTGGAGNWSTGFTAPPVNNTQLVFTGAGGGVSTNNIASATMNAITTITFNSGAGAFTLNASAGSAGIDSATPLVSNGSIIRAV